MLERGGVPRAIVDRLGDIGISSICNLVAAIKTAKYYELDGRDRHEDVEVVTEHYRGAHARSVARAGFRCYGSGRRGGRGFDPGFAEDFL